MAPAGHGRAGLAGVPDGTPAAGVAAAFERDLARLGDRAAVARALLTALAWGQGPGLPDGDLWVDVARVVMTDDGNDRAGLITARDARWLRGVAAPYLARGTGPGGWELHRLRHDPLAAYLRGEPPAGDAEGWERHRAELERRVTGALLAGVPRGRRGRDWAAGHPYARVYLAAHAAAAGPESLLALVREPGFLVWSDPGILGPLLTVTDRRWRDVARVYRRASPLFGRDPRANAAYLAEAASALTERGEDYGSAAGPRPLYRTRLAVVRHDDSLLTITGHVGAAAARFGAAPDGRLLLASWGDDSTVRIWDPVTGTPVSEPMTGHTGWIGSAAFGSVAADRERSGERLLLASAGEDSLVRVWDPLTGKLLWELAGHTGSVFTVAFGRCPDGRLLLATGGRKTDPTVRLWDPDAGEPFGDPLTGHTGSVNGVAFGTLTEESGGRRLLLASASGDTTARLWDPLTGEPICAPLTGHTASVRFVAFGETRDGQLLLASCSPDRTVRLWDPRTGAPIGQPLTGHAHDVLHVAFGRVPAGDDVATAGGTGLLLGSCGLDKTVRLWDPLPGELLGELTGHPSAVGSVEFGTLPGGELLLASGGIDGPVRIWDPIDRARPGTPADPRAYLVDSVAFGVMEAGGGGPLLAFTSGEDYRVRVWRPFDGSTAAGPLAGHTDSVHSVAWGATADGRALLASGGADKTVRVWDPVTGEPVGAPVMGFEGQVRSVALARMPGGRLLLAAAGDDGQVRTWDPLTGEVMGSPLARHDGWVDTIAFATLPGDGKRALLASAGADGSVRLWDPLTGEPIGAPLTGHEGAVHALAFTTLPDGRVSLASGGDDQTVRVWDPLTGNPAGDPLTGHSGWVRALAFTAAGDGSPLLASGGGDKTVRVWDPLEGTVVTELHRGSTVRSLAASGPLLAIGDDEGLTVIELDDPGA